MRLKKLKNSKLKEKNYKIYNEDCISGMKKIPENSINLIITDPPFAINFKANKANYNRLYKNVLEGYSDILPEDYFQFTQNWMKEAYRVLSDSGSMYIFSGWNHLKDILITIDDLKLTVINHLIWKYQFGVVTKTRFVTSHYHILYVCKDDKEKYFNNNCRFSSENKTETKGSARYRDMEDVFVINRDFFAGEMKTPTKLPYDLIEKLIVYSSKPGDTILDCFLGSGIAGLIANKLNRKFIGFEIVKAYFDFAEKRLKNENKKTYIKIS